ncbi:MAG TPA: DNA primase [Sphingomonas sp.]|jgi:DNA primase
MTLTPAFLDELRARTSLSALVAKTVKLQKAGREMRGCCPFHNEKTPSFYVNDDKGFYHCFGCSAHGDAIRWMTDQRGLPFIDAVKDLAQAAGMEVPSPSPHAARQAERARGLHEVMDDAARWFADQLNGLGGSEAREILNKRGINPDTARAFGLGFAPDARGRLKTALADYGDPLLVEAGLLIQVDGKDPYDRFRGRLTIPIRDPRGRTIAFGARIIGAGEPKYLNSPDTPLFDKGRTLYNLDRAATPARAAARLFVVEGYMDVIALAQAGIGEAVAPLGTALTEAQLERLWRVVDVPTLCFDGDAAGQKAALRAAHRALPLMKPGRSLRFVTMPAGQDPDDLVRAQGKAGFEAAVEQGCDLVTFLWNAERARHDTASPDGRTQLKQVLLDATATIPHPILRSEYTRAINDLFFAEFGWKKREWKPGEVATVRDAMAALQAEGLGRPDVALFRAVLLGLSRYPEVLRGEVETLIRLELPNAYLESWLRVLTDAALGGAMLDECTIETILSQSNVSPVETRNLTHDLAFSFFHRDADRAKAQDDLHQVIHVLAWEQEIARSLQAAIDRFAADMTEANWLEQQRLMDEKARLDRQFHDYLELAREAA